MTQFYFSLFCTYTMFYLPILLFMDTWISKHNLLKLNMYIRIVLLILGKLQYD